MWQMPVQLAAGATVEAATYLILSYGLIHHKLHRASVCFATLHRNCVAQKEADMSSEREMVLQQIAEMQAQLAVQSAGDQPHRLASHTLTL